MERTDRDTDWSTAPVRYTRQESVDWWNRHSDAPSKSSSLPTPGWWWGEAAAVGPAGSRARRERWERPGDEVWPVSALGADGPATTLVSDTRPSKREGDAMSSPRRPPPPPVQSTVAAPEASTAESHPPSSPPCGPCCAGVAGSGRGTRSLCRRWLLFRLVAQGSMRPDELVLVLSHCLSDCACDKRWYARVEGPLDQSRWLVLVRLDPNLTAVPSHPAPSVSSFWEKWGHRLVRKQYRGSSFGCCPAAVVAHANLWRDMLLEGGDGVFRVGDATLLDALRDEAVLAAKAGTVIHRHM